MSVPRHIFLVLFNAWFYSAFILFSLLVIPPVTLAFVLLKVMIRRRHLDHGVRRAISWFGWVVIKVLPFPFIRVQCIHPTPAKPAGPFLFVCNHRAASDAALMACLPYECVQVVNTWPFRIPVYGWIAHAAGYLNIHRMALNDFYTQANALLDQGVSVIVFPEGTRSGTREMGPFHGSVFRLALQSGVPIVPICIAGNENIPPKGSLLLHPGKVTVSRLSPITREQYKHLDAFHLKNLVRRQIEEGLRILEAHDETGT